MCATDRRETALSYEHGHNVRVTQPRTSERDAPEGAVRGRRRRSPLTVVGVVLLVAGLACLSWLGYQYVGTDVVAKRSFDQEERTLRSEWSSPSAGPATGAPSDPARSPAQDDVPGSAIALLRVPRFGADFVVPVVAGTTTAALARGVGHYAGTAGPGAVGNFAIAGHRITHGQPFARLLTLEKGDRVVVETSSAVYTYVMDTAPRDLTVTDTAGWVLDPVPGQPEARPTQALITLTTCQDLFHSPDRSVGFGHLDSTQPR